MNSGSKRSRLQPNDVIERLGTAMAGGNFEILRKESDQIEFRHGTLLTQTATMLPKKGTLRAIATDDGGSLVEYEIEVVGFAKYWMMLFAILFCWLIFPPIIVFRTLKHHPDQLMKNLLNAV